MPDSGGSSGRSSRGSGSFTVHPAEEHVVYMDIAGMRSEDFTVQYVDGVLIIAGERAARRHEGKPHYHAMEVQVGPFERRFRLPVPVDPESIRASYEHGFLEVRLTKLPARLSGPQSGRELGEPYLEEPDRR